MKKLVFIICFFLPINILGLNRDTLAPHPLYFTIDGSPKKEYVEIAGQKYVVNWDGHSLTLEHINPLFGYFWLFGEPPNEGPPNLTALIFGDDDDDRSMKIREMNAWFESVIDLYATTHFIRPLPRNDPNTSTYWLLWFWNQNFKDEEE